jgi:hypothetical protein
MFVQSGTLRPDVGSARLRDPGGASGSAGLGETLKKTADLSTALRSGRDDKFVAREFPVYPRQTWR